MARFLWFRRLVLFQCLCIWMILLVFNSSVKEANSDTQTNGFLKDGNKYIKNSSSNEKENARQSATNFFGVPTLSQCIHRRKKGSTSPEATTASRPTSLLRIPCRILKYHQISAYLDTGAQVTVMSSSTARRLGLFVDRRHKGRAIGVGTTAVNIVGRIHNLELMLGEKNIVSAVVDVFVLGSQNGDEEDGVDLLIGLDLLKKLKACIDLGEKHIRVKVKENGGSGDTTHVTIPFWNYSDKDEHQDHLDMNKTENCGESSENKMIDGERHAHYVKGSDCLTNSLSWNRFTCSSISNNRKLTNVEKTVDAQKSTLSPSTREVIDKKNKKEKKIVEVEDIDFTGI